ncbi:uncharacterized protein K460DRAFT_364411 [Cucurbitaria berberidis CBS 394.84]|uniref:DNA-binding protein REB1 n=1 Tax=Cucurbitaria berberidis CBS 394.84 TaxID=1168544 RepID=A0A9P4LBJ3_9PLEO|nr:uncharacterized protein K460DRAFT_364411 [Cucurbitaria berberidis CBS 394.84]KAF1848422.1 hypothetical protein K460DRAFT_364411 [Cucurbitaria berberidis CBS 394.84]
MDDVAASQQLMDEEAQAEHRMDYNEEDPLVKGVEESTSSVRNKRKSDGARKSKASSTPQAAASQAALHNLPFPEPLRSYSLSDLQGFTASDEMNNVSSGWPIPPLKSQTTNDITPHNDDVEVPDSQIAPTTTHALMSPPMTSSLAGPASTPDMSSTSRKGKRRLRNEIDPSNILPEEKGSRRGRNTPTSANEMFTSSFSQPKRQLRRSSIATPTPLSQAEPIHMSSVEDTIAVIPHSPVADQEVGTLTLNKRDNKSKNLRKSRAREVIGNSDRDVEDEDEIIDGRQEGSARVLRRPERSRQRTPGVEAELDSSSGLNADVVTGVDGFTPVQNADDLTIHDETPSARRKKKANSIEVYDWPATARKLGQHVDEPFAFTDEGEVGENADSSHAELESTSRRRRKEVQTKSADEARVEDPVTSMPESDIDSLFVPLEPTSTDDDFVPLENSTGDTETPSMHLPEQKGSATKREHKKARNSSQRSESRRRARASKVDPSNTLTAAERSLNTVRDVNHPPNLQTSGDFTQDEDELIRRAIWDYQQRKGLDTSELVEVIQWINDTRDASTPRRRSDWAPQEVLDEQESREFWDEMRCINLTRKPEKVRKHIRSQYHSYKSGGWTEEEDEHVKNLYELHPRQWKLIAQVLGDRSMHDVHNRWRDYLQYGDSRNTSKWSQDEEMLLIRAITTVAQRDEDYRAEVGKPPLDKYASKDINWAQVCIEMGNTRSRLQSSVKWTKMQNRNDPPHIELEIKPRKTVARDQEAEPVVEPTPRKRGRPRKSEALQTPKSSTKSSKGRGRPRKSGDGSILGGGESSKKRRQSRLKRGLSVEDDEADGESLTKQPKKRRKLTESHGTALEAQTAESEQRATEKSTPPPRSSAVIGTPGASQMRWGDKFDLIEALLTREKESAENIDWHDVAAAMQQSWSVRTLQAAQQQLFEMVKDKELVEGQASFEQMAEAVFNFLVEEHGDELKEHHDPYADAEMDEDAGEIATAALPNTKRKRSRGKTIRRRGTQPKLPPSTPKAFKSAELITESDNAESEAEV